MKVTSEILPSEGVSKELLDEVQLEYIEAVETEQHAQSDAGLDSDSESGLESDSDRGPDSGDGSPTTASLRTEVLEVKDHRDGLPVAIKEDHSSPKIEIFEKDDRDGLPVAIKEDHSSPKLEISEKDDRDGLPVAIKEDHNSPKLEISEKQPIPEAESSKSKPAWSTTDAACESAVPTKNNRKLSSGSIIQLEVFVSESQRPSVGPSDRFGSEPQRPSVGPSSVTKLPSLEEGRKDTKMLPSSEQALLPSHASSPPAGAPAGALPPMPKSELHHSTDVQITG